MLSTPIRVLIVDDHPIVREGLRMLLSEVPDIQIVGEGASGTEAVSLAASLHPDLVLMDLVMPEMDGIQAMQSLHAVSPSCRVLVLTSFGDDRHVHDALQAGAVGYVLKDMRQADLLQAIRAAAQGQPALHPEVQRQLMRQVSASVDVPMAGAWFDILTPRERDVLQLLARGQSNKEIAAALHVSEGTIKGHVSAILAKLGVADRTQAALYAVQHGWKIDPCAT